MTVRSKMRFPAEVGEIAMIDRDCESEDSGELIPALIINESYNGCALILKSKDAPEMGSKCLITLGRNTPYLAETVWVVNVEEEVTKAGFQFLD